MEIIDLEQAIRRASYLYYNEPENVVILDEQFDELVRELKERAPDSPVHNEIGATPIEGKVRHYKKMYSLDNAMNESEAHKFCNKVWHSDLVVSQKMDGAGVELIYWDGALHMATTRGDGSWGDEIPHIIDIVPRQLNGDPEKIVAVYGEVTINGPSFESLGNGYSSPRNLAAGSLMTKDNSMVLKERGAQFLAHGLSGPGDYGLKMARLEDLGFNTVPYTVTKGWDGVQSAYYMLYKMRDEFYQKYGPSDGVVIRVDNREHADAMGYGNKAPKFAIAWKFPAEEKTVIVKNIRWDVSKNGRLTPVAEFDGVEIDGATITNCTLSNASIVRDKRIGVGCTMIIIRSGGVIPKFIRRLNGGYSMDLNKIECPSCGSIGVWDDNKTFLHCPNEACPAQAADFIVEFLDRLEYKGLGDKSAQKLVENGCKTPADVFRVGVGGIMDFLGFSKIHAIEVHQQLQDLKHKASRKWKANLKSG
jgi:DNA ligase (NAD+)